MKPLLLAALLLTGSTAPDPLDRACPGNLCVVPKAQMRALLDEHNEHAADVEKLERMLKNFSRDCRAA